MTKFLGTYDPKEVTLSYGGYLISGYADGTMITVARTDKEIWKLHVGAGGEGARTKNNNTSGTITFRLKATSPSRVQLDLLKNSPTPLPVLVKNNSDQKYMAAMAEAWLKTDPDVELAQEESMVEFVIEGVDLNQSAL